MKPRTLITLALIATYILIVSGCASVPRATQGGRVLDLWSQVSSKEFIRVRGIGMAEAKIARLTERRGASRNAALVAARYELLSLIKGVKLEGGVTIAQLMEKDSIIREIANEMVSGGNEVLTEWTGDGGCVITLELKRSMVERLIKEKSEREKGLEARVAKDIAEIMALRGEVEELREGMFPATDAETLRWLEKMLSSVTQRAAKLSVDSRPNSDKLGDRIDVLEGTLKFLEMTPEEQQAAAREEREQYLRDAVQWRETHTAEIEANARWLQRASPYQSDTTKLPGMTSASR